MPSGERLSPRDRVKVRLPFDVLHRIELLTDGVKNRILESSYVKAAKRKRGAQAWRVNDEDVLRSSCQVLRETLSAVEVELSKYGKRAIRVRDAS